MRTVIKSPVSRMGGKYFLKDWLTQKLPGHALYCEPFCGAGHLLFSKPVSKVEVINDIDNHLINFFAVLKDSEKRQKLIETLDYMLYSRSIWQDIREQWREGNLPDDEIERASWWFYLNRTCFSGDQKRGGFAVPSITGRNPIISFRNTVDSLYSVAERLKNVCIENLDYKECIQRYVSKDTLFYCDPPYWNTEHYYNKDSFAQEDHLILAKLLNGINSKVMVSHCQNSLYDELFKGWHRYEYSTFKGSHKAEKDTEKPRVIEVLYCNFEPEHKINALFKNT
jgi:DNA adenine methylase